jgi:hypothetical protein
VEQARDFFDELAAANPRNEWEEADGRLQVLPSTIKVGSTIALWDLARQGKSCWLAKVLAVDLDTEEVTVHYYGCYNSRAPTFRLQYHDRDGNFGTRNGPGVAPWTATEQFANILMSGLEVNRLGQVQNVLPLPPTTMKEAREAALAADE